MIPPKNNHRFPSVRRQSSRLAAFAALSLLLSLQSCFTGIESTPKISENDLRRDLTAERPEQRYLDDILPQPPARWLPGKQWYVTDPRSQRLYGHNLAGQTIAFSSFDRAASITGGSEAIATFTSPEGTVSYRTGFAPDSIAALPALPIPYAVEASTVDAVARRMTGQTYWVNTTLWGDMEGGSIRGLRYLPVEVTDVSPGEGIYPLRVTLAYTPPEGLSSAPGVIKPGDDTRRYFTLNMAAPGTEGGTTRGFENLFLLADPRKRYPKITDAVWLNIVAGRVAEGMTRDECRLSIGAPDEINRQPGYSSLREVWTYPDGMRLLFVDGLLSSAFR